MRIADSLFCSWLFSFWQHTTMPVGRCVIRTAESVVLTDWPPGPDERNTSIRRSFGSIVHVDVLGLGQHQHAGRRGVDAALRLGDRHPLHPVHAALPLQPRPDAVAALGHALGLDRDRDVLDAAQVRLLRVDHLDDPAVPLGVPGVHPQQVAGEQRRLLAALAGLDLDDHVLGVVRVARDQHLAELLLQRRQRRRRPPRPRAANAGSSAASSRAAARSARAASSSAAALWIGASSAKRRPTRRTRAWSAWMDGSSIRFSSSAYSVEQRGQPVVAHDVDSCAVCDRAGRGTRTAPAPGASRGAGAVEAATCLLGRLTLAYFCLELRDPAGGVEHALLAGVERVAGAAGLDVDLAALGGAAGGEGAAAGADDLGGRVLRVDVRASCRLGPLVEWSPGRRQHRSRPARADELGREPEPGWPMDQSAMWRRPRIG